MRKSGKKVEQVSREEILRLANTLIRELKEQDSYFVEIIASSVSQREEFTEENIESWARESDNNWECGYEIE